MSGRGAESLEIADAYRAMLETFGLTTAKAFFSDGRFRVWRDVHDRQNATFDEAYAGRQIRLHLKRDSKRVREPLALEARGIVLLDSAGIPTARRVAHGRLADGRSFIVTEQLYRHRAADMLLNEQPDLLRPILSATAEIAARLHAAGLHHRDLYLNHFFVDVEAPTRLCLIDTARVRALPRFFSSRWIVKDLAQFFYSVSKYEILDGELVDPWLDRYLIGRSIDPSERERSRLWHPVSRKMASIERRDRRVRRREPGRNKPIDDEMF